MLTNDKRQSVTNEALNMLEVYLLFDSLNTAHPGQGDTDNLRSAVKPECYSSLRQSTNVTSHLDNYGSFKKSGLWDPLTRAPQSVLNSPHPVKVSDHRCSLCGKDVAEQTRIARSALSAQCSPERRMPLDTRNSLPFGCERLLKSQQCTSSSEQEQKTTVFALAHAEETLEMEELLSACPLPLLESPPPDSQPQSFCDRVDGVDPLQHQRSYFSTCPSIEPYSLPTSGVPSRTPSQLKTHGCFSTIATSQGDAQSASSLRSHSTGCNALPKPVQIPPSVHWSSPSGTTDPVLSYTRCVSVHSAPGDARHRVDPDKSKRHSTHKWFRFGLTRTHRKFSKPSDLPRNIESFSTSHGSVQEETPLTQKKSKTPSSHLGLTGFFHLIPRWLRGRDTSPDTYVSTGFPVRLRRSVFRNVARRKRHKVYEKSALGRTTPVTDSTRVPRLSPIYIPDRLSGINVNPSDQESTVLNSQSYVPSQNSHISDSTCTSDVTSPTILSEVSRLYGEIIHTAEGGRLGESTAQVWRSVTDQTVVVNNSSVALVSDTPTPDISPTHVITASHAGLLSSRTLNSIDELHPTPNDRLLQLLKPNPTDTTTITSGYTDGPSFLIGSDPTTPDPRFLNTSEISGTKSSDSSCDSPILLSPPPSKPMEPSLCPNSLSGEQDDRNAAEGNTENYVIYVVAMIDVLSQRIMNEISDDDLVQRFQRLEAEAASSLGYVRIADDPRRNPIPVSSLQYSQSGAGGTPVHHKKSSVHETDHRKRNVLEESHTIERVLLAQVRRLERRKQLDIKIDLLNHLPQHTQYTTFEADMLRLLGRQPSWHHIAILYYLARCTVRHVLRTHLTELDALQHAHPSQPRLRSASSAAMLEELNQVERKFSSIGLASTNSDPAQTVPKERMLAEIGRCRARVERIKDFTITFFTRWYADWVSKHGGWRSLLEDPEDSELD